MRALVLVVLWILASSCKREIVWGATGSILRAEIPGGMTGFVASTETEL